MYQDVEGTCKLTINEVFPEDAGVYTCRAVNPVGEAVCATALVVEGNTRSFFYNMSDLFPTICSK